MTCLVALLVVVGVLAGVIGLMWWALMRAFADGQREME